MHGQAKLACIFRALSDFTESNGATRVVPFSHRLAREDTIPEEATIRAAMPAGSVMLWVGATAHGASSCIGTAETTGKRSGLLKSEHNFHFSIPAEVQDTFSGELRDLLGHSGTNAMDRTCNNQIRTFVGTFDPCALCYLYSFPVTSV
eukprot:SAG31_NODE_3853_length_3816_cov_1.535647_1_plen_148_part_00